MTDMTDMTGYDRIMDGHERTCSISDIPARRETVIRARRLVPIGHSSVFTKKEGAIAL